MYARQDTADHISLGAGVTPGMRVTPASQLLARTGTAAAAAAAGAGKALFPMFEHLANNMIGGDNPALLEELK